MYNQGMLNLVFKDYDYFSRTMRLSSIGLTLIPANAFINFPQLDSLTLDVDNISRITKEAFNGLEKLRQLSLINNNLTTLRRNSFSGVSLN